MSSQCSKLCGSSPYLPLNRGKGSLLPAYDPAPPTKLGPAGHPAPPTKQRDMGPADHPAPPTKQRHGSCLYVASFPGRRRNGPATSASSNCYFHCLKVSSTNQISECSHMTTVKPNCVMRLNCRSHAHSISIAIARSR